MSLDVMFEPVEQTAQSLILDLLATLRDGSMPVRALVAAGEVFGVAENAVRVTLARLLRRGLVDRDERGRYRLGRAAEGVRRRVVSWRRAGERGAPWSGAWVGVGAAGAGRGRSAAARHHRRALRLLGFRPLVGDLCVRPDNLAGGVEATRAGLRSLGLAPGAWVARLDALDPDLDRAARSLWDVAALEAGYADSLRALAESTARLAGLTTEQAMVESFHVGGAVIRQLVLDPLLPDPIAQAEPRERLVAALRAYDALGRSCWAEFLARYDVPHRRHPVERGVSEAAGGWSALHRESAAMEA